MTYADGVGWMRSAAAATSAVLALTALTAFAPPATAAASASHHSPDVTSIGRETAHLRFTLSGRGGAHMEPNAPNLASRTTSAGPLLLFLAATRARPTDYRSFLAVAKSSGYHVLALDYWNRGLSVEKTCGEHPKCYTDLQRNRLDGSHKTVFSSVSPADSILTRLQRSLHYLAVTDKQGGWQQYLRGSTIDWHRIVVAGHSQGGGESAYIAHLHRVRGALMFSSPVDTSHGIAASWMGSPGATPAVDMYGFIDRGDVFYNRIRGSWTELGLDRFGSPQNASLAPPYTSHELLSEVDLGRPGEAHLRTITDKTPLSPSGAPVFAPVWKWMLNRLYSPAPGLALPTDKSIADS
jgi:pimeloyl-ACP methyl ester carboxylesterase